MWWPVISTCLAFPLVFAWIAAHGDNPNVAAGGALFGLVLYLLGMGGAIGIERSKS